MTLMTDEARRWAEQEYPDATFEVSRNDIVRYARAIGESNPIHLDAEAARRAGHADVVAPPLFPYVIRTNTANLVTRSEIAPDGSAGADVPPVETTRAMAGETNIEVGVPIIAGDTITVSKRIVDMYEKEGRSGPLVFVTMEFRFTNEDGEKAAVETFTRIYR